MAYVAGSELLVLPFDHRSSFEKLLVEKGTELTKEQVKQLEGFKEVIYDAYLKCLKQGTVKKENSAVLTDYQYGYNVLDRARNDGVIFATCFEKSGKDLFELEYPDYKKTISKIDPTIVKVLVRMNPEWKREDNELQLKRLKELQDYCHSIGKHFLFELLVPATKRQLKKFGVENYELKERPKLTSKCIEMIHAAGVEPDIWKIEGFQDLPSVNSVVSEALEQERKTGVIILGRGENVDKVKHWLKMAKGVHGVIGFAVGRTVFLEPIKDFQAGKITREQAVKQIADNYSLLVNLWRSK